MFYQREEGDLWMREEGSIISILEELISRGIARLGKRYLHAVDRWKESAQKELDGIEHSTEMDHKYYLMRGGIIGPLFQVTVWSYCLKDLMQANRLFISLI